MIVRHLLFVLIILYFCNSFFLNNSFAITKHDIDEYLKGNLHLNEREVDDYIKKELGISNEELNKLTRTVIDKMIFRINNYPYFKNVSWTSTDSWKTAYCDIDIARLEIDMAKLAKKPVALKASNCMLTIEFDTDFKSTGMLLNIRKSNCSKLWPLPRGSKEYRTAIQSIYNGNSNLGVVLWLLVEMDNAE
jgi:hypothetical protein